jgi:hypothetical protein
VYGLAMDNKGQLFACVAQHLQSVDGGVIQSSIYRFDVGQLDDEELGPGNVEQNAMLSSAIFQAGVYVVGGAELNAGRCGHIAFDGNAAIYAPDTSGNTQSIFKYNTEGSLDFPQGQVNDQIGQAEFQDLIMSAWFTNGNLAAGDNFAVGGIAVQGSSVKFIRDDNSGQLFDVTVRSGGGAENNLGNIDINAGFAVANGLAIGRNNRLLVSAVDTDELLELNLADDEFNTNVVFDDTDENAFIGPTGVVVRGEDIIVVAGQILQLGAEQAQTAKIFRVDLP